MLIARALILSITHNFANVVYSGVKKNRVVLMKYSEVVKNYLRYLETIDRSKWTIIGYRKELRYFGEFMMARYGFEKDFEDILLADLENYMYQQKVQGKMSATRSRAV